MSGSIACVVGVRGFGDFQIQAPTPAAAKYGVFKLARGAGYFTQLSHFLKCAASMHWLPDLHHTPWRAIVLSYRQEVWTLVDAADYGWLVDTSWNVWWSGRARWQLYAKRNTGTARDTVRMHREILRRLDPKSPDELLGLHGDHCNGQTLDNRRANLRWLTPQENRANTHVRERIPSLELIVRKLLNTPAARELEDVPF